MVQYLIREFILTIYTLTSMILFLLTHFTNTQYIMWPCAARDTEIGPVSLWPYVWQVVCKMSGWKIDSENIS